MAQEYIRWPTNADIPLSLELADSNGNGVVGATPVIYIRRYKETHGALLDNAYWTGSTFTPVATPILMVAVDEIGSPGQYTYLFRQSLIGLETTYLVYYRNAGAPVGFASEVHVVTNEVYIPTTQPDPVIFGPHSVFGQLELIKDGGTGLFDGTKDSLHYQKRDVDRILGLLHQNSILDKQTFDGAGQMTSARLRVFDAAAHVPAVPGGSEVTGLTQEYVIAAQYSAPGAVTLFSLKRVL